ncbi:hypothetical protein ACMFY5_18635, partial [Pseudomonas sihuiensis]
MRSDVLQCAGRAQERQRTARRHARFGLATCTWRSNGVLPSASTPYSAVCILAGRVKPATL